MILILQVCAPCTSSFENGNIIFVMPDSGESAGPLVAGIEVINGLASSGSYNFDLLGALTPKPSSIIPSARTVRINMDKGVNPTCDRNLVLIGGESATVTDCSAVKRTMYIEADMPNLPAGDHSVLVTNMDSGNSDGTHSLTVAFSADSVTPTVSGIVGGAPMTISGSGFGAGFVTVTICGNACAVDPSSTSFDIICTIPVRVKNF